MASALALNVHPRANAYRQLKRATERPQPSRLLPLPAFPGPSPWGTLSELLGKESEPAVAA